MWAARPSIAWIAASSHRVTWPAARRSRKWSAAQALRSAARVSSVERTAQNGRLLTDANSTRPARRRPKRTAARRLRAALSSSPRGFPKSRSMPRESTPMSGVGCDHRSRPMACARDDAGDAVRRGDRDDRPVRAPGPGCAPRSRPVERRRRAVRTRGHNQKVIKARGGAGARRNPGARLARAAAGECGGPTFTEILYCALPFHLESLRRDCHSHTAHERPHAGSRRACLRRCCAAEREDLMLDVLFVAGGLAFFAISVAYTFACDRL